MLPESSTHRSTVVVLCALIPLVGLVAIGFVAQPGAGDTNSDIDIDQTGEPDDILPGNNTQGISDIVLSDPQDHIFEDHTVHLYLNLSAIQSEGVDTSSARVMNSNITGGKVASQEAHTTDSGDDVLVLTIEDTTTDGEVSINSVKLGQLDSTTANFTNQLRYDIVATDGSNTNHSDFLDTREDASFTDTFGIASGELDFPDQSTMSSTFGEDMFTSPAFTIRNLDTNVDSTIIVAYSDESETIVSSVKEVTKDQISNDDPVSVPAQDTRGFPGEMSVYIIPNSRLSDEEYDPGQPISQTSIGAATAVDNASTYLGTVEFDDSEFNATVEDNITVSRAELLDGSDTGAKYVVNLYPVIDDEILFEAPFGSSSVISGDNSNVSISLKDDMEDEIEITTSREYAATIHLADEESMLGDSAQPGEFPSVLNADPDDDFVHGGVAESAMLTIDGKNGTNLNAERTLSITDDYIAQVYAGQSLAVQGGDDENEVKLNRIDGENNSTVISVKSNEEDEQYVTFETAGLQEGSYFLNDSEQTSANFDIVNQTVESHVSNSQVDVNSSNPETDLTLVSENRDQYAVEFSGESLSNGSLSSKELASIIGNLEGWDNRTYRDQYYLDTQYEELDRNSIYDNRDEASQYLVHNDSVILFGSPEEINLNFTDVMTDEYLFSANIFDSDYNSTSKIEVVDFSAGEILLGASVETQNYGDFVEFPFHPVHPTDTARLHITDSDGDDYAGTFELDLSAGEPATVRLNTYAAGDDGLQGALATVVDGPANVTLVDQTTPPNGTLDPGTYDVTVRPGPDADPDDATTLSLDERDTEAITLLTATDVDSETLTDADAVSSAIANDTLAEADTVTDEDTVVYAIDASGLDGLVAAGPTVDTLAALDAREGLGLSVVETDPDDGEEDDWDDADDTDPLTANLSAPSFANATTVFADGDTRYAVFEQADMAFDGGDPEAGDEFDLSFRVTDDRLRTGDDTNSDGDAVATAFSYATDDADDGDNDDDGNDGNDEDDGGDGGFGATTHDTADQDTVEDDGDGDTDLGSTDGDDDGDDVSDGDDSTVDDPPPENDADDDLDPTDEPEVRAEGSTAITGGLPDLADGFGDTPTGDEPMGSARGEDGDGPSGDGEEPTLSDLDHDAIDDEDDAWITVEDVPGFGPAATLVAIVAAGSIARRVSV